jgi:hypothetical protein
VKQLRKAQPFCLLPVILTALLLSMVWDAPPTKAQDSLRVADSLIVPRLEQSLWADSAAADSLQHAKSRDRWWLPLGIIAVSGASVFLLFTLRSR